MFTRAIARVARKAASTAVMTSRVAPVAVRGMSSLTKIAPVVTQSVDTELTHFKEELSSLEDVVKSDILGYAKIESVDDKIVVKFNKNNVDVVVEYNREFEYDDEEEGEDVSDYEASGSESEHSGSESEGADDAPAFHTVTMTFTNKSNVALKLEGTLTMSADFDIHSFSPIVDGVAQRSINTTDIESDTLNGLINVFEAAGVTEEFLSFLVRYAQHERVSQHVKSLESVKNFMQSF
eukprot:TRINITY_DN68242_c0_g1_i1.p1 TRINITY_DN68242_c0_g1~~TRINITY_DN68242_c0_g1_i1.p1  ORF type:complete len:237 (+),score=54.46 TRINITY_DN68242_c0_g1_i1:11-721(+)